MSCNGSDLKSAPSEMELQVYREIILRLKDIIAVNAHLYHGFETSLDPSKRADLARKIQD